MWLQDADEVAEGVFAREDIEAGTFLLDFGELRLATAIESSGQWCGWRLRFDIESKLSTVTRTFVVKDAPTISEPRRWWGPWDVERGKGQQYFLPCS
jgi:hypothetical protein